MGVADCVPPRLPPALPADPGIDGTVGLLSEGYAWISATCDRLRSDGFRTRLAGLPALCVRGPEATRLFSTPAGPVPAAPSG